MLPYNHKLLEISRTLRKHMTDAELRLWSKIRMKQIGYQFYRQKPIGNYIADFYCPRARLVVEVDGGHHYSGDTALHDKARDEYMVRLGLTVIRLSNADVMNNLDGAVQAICEHLGKIPLSPLLRQSSGLAFAKGGG
ncbi:endonuclease domain-containing protein [Dehalogenimonas sp. THU2]|uniref:endonuclease domain-containing protein n=1 Tax=Dehalogenimonas sp. THU2 TaxID=3151121 RepID=UPI003218BEEC